MKILKAFILREIVGDYILVPTGDTAISFNGMITLNRIAAEIWNMIPEASSEEDIVKYIISQYDVSEEKAREDITEFIHKLREKGIVE